MSCLRRSTCSIDGLLVPGWLERDTRGLAVDSSTSETLHVRRLAATLEGEKTQATLAVATSVSLAPDSKPAPGAAR